MLRPVFSQLSSTPGRLTTATSSVDQKKHHISHLSVKGSAAASVAAASVAAASMSFFFTVLFMTFSNFLFLNIHQCFILKSSGCGCGLMLTRGSNCRRFLGGSCVKQLGGGGGAPGSFLAAAASPSSDGVVKVRFPPEEHLTSADSPEPGGALIQAGSSPSAAFASIAGFIKEPTGAIPSCTAAHHPAGSSNSCLKFLLS